MSVGVLYRLYTFVVVYTLLTGLTESVWRALGPCQCPLLLIGSTTTDPLATDVLLLPAGVSSSHLCYNFPTLTHVGEWGWGIEGKQAGSMDEESQVRGCYNITFICTPTNQETVSVLEKTQANKTFRT